MLLDRDAGELERCEGSGAAGGAGLAVDVTDRPARRSIRRSRLGRLDIVFANVGIDAGPAVGRRQCRRGRDRGNLDALWDTVVDISRRCSAPSAPRRT
jgi:hypothetical protein